MNRRLGMTLVTTAATIGLVVPSLASPAAGVPQRPSQDTSSWCSESAPPCITAVTRNGSAVPASDPDWDVELSSDLSHGEDLVTWDVQPTSSPGSLIDMGAGELGDPWSISIDMGQVVPRTTYTTGVDVTVVRDAHSDGTYDITVSGQPVTFEDNSECDTTTATWTCPTVSGKEVTYFGGDVDDFGQWTDVRQRDDFYGMDTWTNVEVSASPPSIIGDPAQLQVQMANSHERPNDEVFHGFYDIDIPNRFLSDMGVDDPSTLGAGGLTTSIGAGTASVTPGTSAVHVAVSGVTFTQRVLKVKRGSITPSRPTSLTAHRTKRRVHLKFHRAKPHGSRIAGYQARCSAAHHPTRTASGKHSPLVVTGLATGVSYRCQVRAKSKAGFGKWSPRHVLAR